MSTKQKKVGIAVLGYGTVGSSTYRILKQKKAYFKKFGLDYDLLYLYVRDKKKKRPGLDPKTTISGDIGGILNDERVKIVIELMGGIEPARKIILDAIKHGKNVVTANKDLIATHGQELFEAADKKGVDLHFEASVAGGIPIIKPLKESLTGNKITSIVGILNGTTNYILTKIAQEKEEFKVALKEAQRLGYAEQDPANDVGGKDAAYKLAILSSIAFNSRVSIKDVYYEGISKVTPEDISYAEQIGYTIKLLAIGKNTGKDIEARVHPTLISSEHPLSSVKGVFNAVFIEADAAGQLMFYGRGAGGDPTASAVVGDVFTSLQNIKNSSTGRVSCTCFDKRKVKKIDEISTAFYLLIEVTDNPGVLAKIAASFANYGVSLDKVIQMQTQKKGAEVMFLTHITEEKKFRAAIRTIENLAVVKSVKNIIRVLADEGIR